MNFFYGKKQYDVLCRAHVRVGFNIVSAPKTHTHKVQMGGNQIVLIPDNLCPATTNMIDPPVCKVSVTESKVYLPYL